MRNSFPWGSAGLTAAATGLLMLVAFFLFDALLIPLWQGKLSSSAVVPDLSGLDSAAASGAILQSGLRVAEPVTREYSGTAAGRVVGQAPAPGHVVKRKRRIKFVLSLGEEMVTVPPLQDLSPTQASDTLQRLGLRIGEVREVYDPRRTPGAIVASTPQAGTTLPRGRAVNLLVSQSGLDLKTEVPDVRNGSLAAAQKTLKRAQLTLRRTLQSASADLVPGTVINQSLPAGAKVDRGTPIDLTVSE